MIPIVNKAPLNLEQVRPYLGVLYAECIIMTNMHVIFLMKDTTVYIIRHIAHNAD